MSTKFFAILAAVLVICAAGLGAVALNHGAALPSPLTSSTSTANWQVYRNDQYGFEVEYPNNLKTDFSNSLNDEARFLVSFCENLPCYGHNGSNYHYPDFYIAVEAVVDESNIAMNVLKPEGIAFPISQELQHHVIIDAQNFSSTNFIEVALNPAGF